MTRFCGLSAAIAAFLLSPAAMAQDAAGAPAAAAGCELHVWPASGLGSVYHGWFHGGIVNGAVTGREGYPAVPADPLGAPEQVKLLDEAAPQTLLGLPTHRLVIHPEALPSRTIRTSTARITGSNAPCYAELIVDDVIFQQDVVNGSYLKILFRFRDFGADAAPKRVFGSFVQTPLLRLPATSPEQLPAALDELRSAFKVDLVLFAKALAKPPKGKKH